MASSPADGRSPALRQTPTVPHYGNLDTNIAVFIGWLDMLWPQSDVERIEMNSTPISLLVSSGESLELRRK